MVRFENSVVLLTLVNQLTPVAILLPAHSQPFLSLMCSLHTTETENECRRRNHVRTTSHRNNSKPFSKLPE